jgi:hypothetical protein
MPERSSDCKCPKKILIANTPKRILNGKYLKEFLFAKA